MAYNKAREEKIMRQCGIDEKIFNNFALKIGLSLILTGGFMRSCRKLVHILKMLQRASSVQR